LGASVVVRRRRRRGGFRVVDVFSDDGIADALPGRAHDACQSETEKRERL
jgi:hypothetical protein